MSEPGKELAVSAAGLEEAENEPFRVTTGPLEVRFPEVNAVDLGETPDWVIFGIPNADGSGVRVFASRTLTRAGMRRVMDGFTEVQVHPNPNVRKAMVPNMVVTVVAVMSDFTNIPAENYPSALRSLMEMWNRASSA